MGIFANNMLAWELSVLEGNINWKLKWKNRVKDKHKNKINKKYIQEKVEVKFYVRDKMKILYYTFVKKWEKNMRFVTWL